MVLLCLLNLKSYAKKPIRFGYKNWVVCSGDGYPYKVTPYQGKSESKHEVLLVSELLRNS